MSDTVLLVPGFHGSGPDHWQSWLERELPESRRVKGIDWELPVLSEWAAAIGREMDASNGRIWLVAHSFGCLASAAALAELRERSAQIAGAILVAPADPERFTAEGPCGDAATVTARRALSVGPLLPVSKFTDFGLLVASRNDPWMTFASARRWADRWGVSLYDAGHAGHINVESGHGRWPLIIELLSAMRRAENSKYAAPAFERRYRPQLAYA